MNEWTVLAEKDRVERYAQSFRKLAELFQYMPVKKEELSEEDIQDIFEDTRNNLCSVCGREKICWVDEVETTWKLAYEMLEELEQGEETRNLERSFTRHCVKGRQFREELKNGFVRARLNLLWSNRMMENRAAMARQLEETAQIIEEIACTVYDTEMVEGDLRRTLAFRLKMNRLVVKDIRILKNQEGRPEILLTLRAGYGKCVQVKEVGRIISEIYGREMVPLKESRVTIGNKICNIHFVEATTYYMITGVAREKCSGESECGDQFSFLNSNYGQAIMALSDGMGCGVKAGRESQTVIELLEQFLESGFTAQTCISMLNSAMVMQRGMRGYSTLDLCEVDLYTGNCRLLKMGAAVTFIQTGNKIETVHTATLPVGALQEVKVEEIPRKLESGSMVILVSDGVMDALPPGREEELFRLFIRQFLVDDPGKMAHLLLGKVMEFCEDGPQDDMTILVGRLWKREC